MCLAIPGKIVKIEKDRATVAYPHETRTARIVQGTYHVGEYVIVQAQLIIERVPQGQAESWNEFLKAQSK